jgi:hypothetical protein
MRRIDIGNIINNRHDISAAVKQNLESQPMCLLYLGFLPRIYHFLIELWTGAQPRALSQIPARNDPVQNKRGTGLEESYRFLAAKFRELVADPGYSIRLIHASGTNQQQFCLRKW